MKQTILIVEDSIDQLVRYKEFADSFLNVITATTVQDAIVSLNKKKIDILLTDIHLTKSIDMDSFEGYQVVDHAIKNHPETLVMVMSSDPKVETYHKIYQMGAHAFVKKPIISIDEIKIAVESAKHKRAINRIQKSKIATFPDEIVGKCADGLVLDPKTRKLALALAKNNTIPGVIYGETGTGKEEVAKIIHKRRVENEGQVPFVAVNCANLSPETAASVIFGHKRGSFTGAHSTTVGLVGEANEGILFLDEIHRLPDDCQARLLRVLNDGTYERFGDTKPLFSSFQTIVASTADLDELVNDGKFLMDLRSRLTGLDIHLEPLRNRKDDLRLLIQLFFAKENMSIPIEQLDEIVEKCKSYYWRGNIRQLFNVLKSFVITCTMNEVELDIEYFPEFATMLGPTENKMCVNKPNQSEDFSMELLDKDAPLRTSLALFEREIIKRAIDRHRSVKSAIAGLQISRSGFDVRRKKYGV